MRLGRRWVGGQRVVRPLPSRSGPGREGEVSRSSGGKRKRPPSRQAPVRVPRARSPWRFDGRCWR
ncbi:MAG: hypothetical protein MZV64_28095 [Ignavibacteriales bacterium]|nr:hypothetical protein [Ignavibacteriales bacterium]